MDGVSTALEIINLIYTTTIFIRDVAQEVKDYGDAKRDISERLEHELVFVETFTDVCFGEERGFLRDSRVRESVKRDVTHCLEALSKALAAYRAEAWKYAGAVPDMVDETADELGKVNLKEESKKKWKNVMKARYQVWTKKAAPLQWALFGKEGMEELLAKYSEWTDRLRQTLSIILLLVGTPTLEFAASTQAKDLGVKEVSERQARVASAPPPEYCALKGDLKDPTNVVPGDGLIKGTYEDESGFDSADVVIEIRSYDEALSLAISERNHEEATELLEPLRQLTWLLQSPVDSSLSEKDAEEGYRMHTLSCLGFIDEPAKNRSLILYRAPSVLSSGQDVSTLHSCISKGQRPMLGNRFLVARALTATLLAVHTSGWVHKNICSRSVLMLPRSNSETFPYLVGWDTARQIDAGTSLHAFFELEPNLYRHAQRFGKPSHKFSNEHDVYSLGVVLLEIGLWRTMSTVFERPLAKNPKIETSQQHALFTRVNGMIQDMANGADLKREMGEKYADVVKSCLTWDAVANQEEAVESSMRLRKEVVDALTAGAKL